MRIEDQLSKIKDKAELKAYIDELPDDVKGLLIVEIPCEHDGEKCTMHRFREIGADTTVAEALYLTRSYEHSLFEKGDE